MAGDLLTRVFATFLARFIFNDPSIHLSSPMLKSSVQNPTPTMQKISSEAEREKRSFAFGKCVFCVRASQPTESSQDPILSALVIISPGILTSIFLGP